MASLSGAPFSLRQQLMLFTVVRLSSLVVVFVPGKKHTTRQLGSCALFGLGVWGSGRLVAYLMWANFWVQCWLPKHKIWSIDGVHVCWLLGLLLVLHGLR